MTKQNYYRCLSIAGSDSGGGAGIQADLKTFTSLGCFGSTVITALTAQNTIGVQEISDVSESFISQQIKSVLSDIGSDAIKIGMLNSASSIDAVAAELKPYQGLPIILDPVMVAKGGCLLLDSRAHQPLREKLFPLATLITPNIHEAEFLLAGKISNKTDMAHAAKKLSEDTNSVLLKGGHLDSTICSDCFYDKTLDKIYWFEQERINSNNTHGTGCSLSSAITAYCAMGETLLDAVAHAISYINKAIQVGDNYTIGQGHGPICYWGL